MTIVATATVTVNAAFLQEIKDDNRDLKRLLVQTANFVPFSYSSRAATRQLADLLGSLRDQLAMHFSLEEAFGYFEDAVDVAPRLCEMAETLRAEHRRLFADICELAEEAERLFHRESSARDAHQIMAALSAFFEEFQRHESQENELILQSLFDDIGVGD